MMRNNLLQICLSEIHSDFLLNVIQYIGRFGCAADNSHLDSLVVEKHNDEWLAFSPELDAKQWITEAGILTIEYLLDLPIGFMFSNEGENLSDKIMDVYNYRININKRDDIDNNLHIIVHIADNDPESLDAFEFLIHSFPSNLRGHIKLHTIIYSSTTYVGRKCKTVQQETPNNIITKILNIRKSIEDTYQLGRLFYVSNYNESGICLNLSRIENLSRFIGRFLIYLINDYQSLTNINSNIDDLTAIGIYGEEINKAKIINDDLVYFLSTILRSFIGQPREKSNNHQGLFKKFVETSQDYIKEEYDSGSLNENDIRSIILKFVQDVQNADMSLSEKKEVLYRLQRLWSQERQDIENTDDDYTYEDIYMPLLSSIGIETPYPEVKELIEQIKTHKYKISNQEEKLEELYKNLPPLEQNCYWTDGGIKIGDSIYKLNDSIHESSIENSEIKEYIPTDKELPVSKDIRNRFSSIKSQGNQGSCVSFGLVSMVEYYLNSSLNNKDLSEAFVYYTTREMTNETANDNGVSIENAISSLKSNGVCVEELCPYDEKVFDRKPCSEAYKDAQNRCISDAERLNNNIRDIKSAISDGHPIIASFRVFKSLEKNTDGFIPMPSDYELSEPEQFHAMVICGYNDSNKYFIVRNSWGTHFGRQGYGYMPYGYVRDNNLTRSLYVIKISVPNSSDLDAISDIDNPADFSPRFNYEISRNKIAEEKLALEAERKSLTEKLIRLRNRVSQIVSDTNAVAITQSEENNLSEQKDALNNHEEQKNKYITTRKKKIKGLFLTVVVGIVTSIILVWYGLSNDNLSSKIAGIVLSLSSISSFVWYYIVSKRNLAKMESERQKMCSNISALENSIKKAKSNYERLQTLLLILYKVDDSIRTYNENLSDVSSSFEDWYSSILSFKKQDSRKGSNDINVKDEVHRLFKYVFNPDENNSIQSRFFRYQIDLLKRLNSQFNESITKIISDNTLWESFLERLDRTAVTIRINGAFTKVPRLIFIGALNDASIHKLQTPNKVVPYSNPLLMFGIIEKKFTIESLHELSL